MRKQLIVILLGMVLASSVACQSDKPASGAGQEQLPPDVLAAVKPLIKGNLYLSPNFEAAIIARFDTLQTLYILDTADPVFVKARLKQDSVITGYIPKIILPDHTKR